VICSNPSQISGSLDAKAGDPPSFYGLDTTGLFLDVHNYCNKALAEVLAVAEFSECGCAGNA
jgi:hypothetical protein